MVPSEVDTSCADGMVFGVKHAAIRKLDHELGIPPTQLQLDKFKFLTRLHYWAADTVTHGPNRYAVACVFVSFLVIFSSPSMIVSANMFTH